MFSKPHLRRFNPINVEWIRLSKKEKPAESRNGPFFARGIIFFLPEIK
jgi:hypothetical protein